MITSVIEWTVFIELHTEHKLSLQEIFLTFISKHELELYIQTKTIKKNECVFSWKLDSIKRMSETSSNRVHRSWRAEPKLA